MKILKISGKNLASLAGQFSVDFGQEPLASSGLFAISGPTGAGKSTLLDALCLALYDATPRLLKVAGRGSALPDVGKETVSAHETSTLLRRGCADGWAEVDFVGNDGAAYRARWSVRRARTKAEGSLQPTAMSLQQLPALLPLGGTKTEVKAEIVRRIGLSFEQFTRAVLLAQNEFATFLKTEDNERGELLETLTGSTVYSDISMRAFERAKLEKAALQRLRDKLADQAPLDGAERAGLDARSAEAGAALAVLEQRRALLEQQLRWQQQAQRLEQHEQLAQQAQQASQAALEEAAPRRAALARSEAVQAARPLADALARDTAAITATEAQLTASQAGAAQARASLAGLAGALQESAAALLAAENARRAAAPQLNQAKALDARLVDQAGAHRQAALAAQAADAAAEAASAGMQEQRARHASLDQARQAGALWLAQHQPWQALAQSWPRWDLLFTQAEQAAGQAQATARTLAATRQAAQDSGAAEAAARAGLEAASAALQELEERRQQTAAALAGFDADTVQERRRQLERRREALAGADKTWSALAAAQARAGALAEQAGTLRQAREAAGAALELAGREAGAIGAALAQAERSLNSAEAACAENVETLRASLEDAMPCPVCGACAHPYRDGGGALHAMLASLREEVRLCRRRNEDNIGAQASARATAAGSATQLDTVEAEQAALAAALAAARADWDSQAAALALPAGAEAGAWLAAQGAAVQAGAQALEQQEQALRQATLAHEQARQASEQAGRQQQHLSEAAAAARAALAQARAALAALEDKHGALAQQLAGLLDELAPAFEHADFGAEDWREHWHNGPERFHAARAAERRQWQAQHGAQEERGAALAKLEVELAAAATVLDKAALDAQAARAVLHTQAQALAAMQAQRAALWQGRAVDAVETGLNEAVEQAQLTRQGLQARHALAGQTCARLDEARDQADNRLRQLRASAQQAGAGLAGWLSDFQRQAEGAPPDLPALHALLAVPLAALQAERQALQALDQAAATAATVLGERRSQRELHLLAAPEGAIEAVDTQAALATLEAERKLAHDAATALQLAQAQDEARRHSAQALLADVALQEEIELRWARMNELIGSADGRKFRNYAQQFTLEVLLGYANAHLNQLARRYQLERINHPANPSLGLMVRDQDMGGELRSVHSLSGGEAFLVSLALALGLASLSSNRVRVESLFIDEGFGSLDTDTLRVAMDALDGLQSLGRKVGVISHVQEMTERIATRILVQPGAGGSSSVSVQ